MQPNEPILTRIQNGWHCGSPTLNITVKGSTPEEAKRLFSAAVDKAAEIRSRPAGRHFANPS
jgi:hypothetical protein